MELGKGQWCAESLEECGIIEGEDKIIYSINQHWDVATWAKQHQPRNVCKMRGKREGRSVDFVLQAGRDLTEVMGQEIMKEQGAPNSYENGGHNGKQQLAYSSIDLEHE